MAFSQFLRQFSADKEPSLLDMHKAFSVVATLYIQDALNLVSDAAEDPSNKNDVLAKADILFFAWEEELKSVKFSISRLSRLPSHKIAKPWRRS